MTVGMAGLLSSLNNEPIVSATADKTLRSTDSSYATSRPYSGGRQTPPRHTSPPAGVGVTVARPITVTVSAIVPDTDCAMAFRSRTVVTTADVARLRAVVHRRIVLGNMGEAAVLGPTGEDVAGKVVDHADRPDQQRPDHLRIEGLRGVLATAACNGCWEVVVDAFAVPPQGKAGVHPAEKRPYTPNDHCKF